MNQIFEWLYSSLFILAKASGGSPIIAVGTIILFGAIFNVFEALVEVLIFGEPFAHFLDIVFMTFLTAYAAASVWVCAEFNSEK